MASAEVLGALTFYDPVACDSYLKCSPSRTAKATRARSLLRTFDFPFSSSRYQPHLAPRSPPVIHFPRQRPPNSLVRDSFMQVIEECFVQVAVAGFDQVIRVYAKTSQSMILGDEFELTHPQSIE
jgi:hypothetical protein